MAATVVYGALAYVLLRSLHRWRSGVLMVAIAILLVLLIALSRLYLGAVEFSDVLVGMIEGSAWLLLCVSGVEIVRWREQAHLSIGQEIPP